MPYSDPVPTDHGLALAHAWLDNLALMTRRQAKRYWERLDQVIAEAHADGYAHHLAEAQAEAIVEALEWGGHDLEAYALAWAYDDAIGLA